MQSIAQSYVLMQSMAQSYVYLLRKQTQWVQMLHSLKLERMGLQIKAMSHLPHNLCPKDLTV